MRRAVLFSGSGTRSVGEREQARRLPPPAGRHKVSWTQLNNRIQDKEAMRKSNAKERESINFSVSHVTAVNKSIRGMPGRRVPKKDVVHCEKRW